VVSKLLTGFDAPSCTYIYLDNELRDHNLFQAICRTNRLDGDDKDYGHIVDFKELFERRAAGHRRLQLGRAGHRRGVAVTTTSPEGLAGRKARKQLDAAREALRYLCEPVAAAARDGAVPPLLLRRCRPTRTR
jgi:type I restriction enzyme R subunit